MSYLRSISLAVVLAGACAVGIVAQVGDGAGGKQRDLDRLRASIRDSEQRLRQIESTARRSTSAIDEYRRQSLALDTLVNALQGEEQRLASEMIAVRQGRDSLSDVRAILRATYGRMARALFKNRLLTTSASVLLLPEEHQHLALRQWLFERYARIQHARAARIADLNTTLARHDSVLQRRQQEQLAVIEEKRSEMERLFDLQRTQASALDKAFTEQSALKSQLDRQNAEAGEISEMIARLARKDDSRLEQDKARRQQAAQARNPAAHGTADAAASGGADAANHQRGAATAADVPTRRRSGAISFVWPTSGRKIVEAYGERTNPATGTVTINPGINIAAASGSAVLASEDGVVSLVSWLPSYGTIVIMEHRDGYRTVYGNLASASVSRGTSIGAGGRIGLVGGGSVHFEIWRGQTRLNPLTMLK